MLGVFCSLDLVVFYLFFEGGLIPMFFNYWYLGWSKKGFIQHSSFFLFTLLGSVFNVSLQSYLFIGLQEPLM